MNMKKTKIELSSELAEKILSSDSGNMKESITNAILKNEGLSDEEIKNNSLSIFEHLRTPEDKIHVISILRILDMLPVMEQMFLDDMIDRLTAQNLFKQNIKVKLKQCRSLLDTIHTEVWNKCDKSGENTKESQESWYLNMFDFCNKFSNAIKNYVIQIEALTNASEGFVTNNERDDYIIDKAKFISQLKEGDVFAFLDASQYIEYTYLRTDKETEDYKFYYKKYTSDDGPEYIPFYTDNAFRPVIITSVLTEEDLKELPNILKRN